MRCDMCGSEHSAVFIDTRQGYGCSTEVFIRDGSVMAYGAFGSTRHDARLYELSGDARAECEPGWLLCDDCVDAMVTAGEATLVADSLRIGLGGD